MKNRSNDYRFGKTEKSPKSNSRSRKPRSVGPRSSSSKSKSPYKKNSKTNKPRAFKSTSNKLDNKEKLHETQRFYTRQDIFLSRMASILKIPKGTISNIFSERAVSMIRINNLAGDPDKIVSILTKKGANLQPIKWLPYTYRVTNMEKRDLGNLHEYEKGLFYIQNLSSMLPAVLLNSQPDDTVLDMCAAPGSKTTQLAAAMTNKGLIAANDDDAWRADKLMNVLKQFNVKNSKVTIARGEEIGQDTPNKYDKILLDAPCSGEGMVYLKGFKPLRFWSVKKVKASVAIQQKLIESAYKALKPGGVIVYSTCTLEPEENEGALTYLLSKYPEAKIDGLNFWGDNGLAYQYTKSVLTNLGKDELVKKMNKDDFTQPEFMNIKSGFASWNEIEFNPEVKKTLRILPSAECTGFYLSRIRKPK